MDHQPSFSWPIGVTTVSISASPHLEVLHVCTATSAPERALKGRIEGPFATNDANKRTQIAERGRTVSGPGHIMRACSPPNVMRRANDLLGSTAHFSHPGQVDV